ncbi:MAG: metallophosphoesterase [Syntrophomonadaceae bacterium]|nr:metallophosphoesterase [Syntrophomonadaceae bacterium]
MTFKSKGFKTIGLITVILIVFVALYNVYDNNRVTVVRQEVEIDDLPDSFDGFTILQITDLHGKRFGKNQEHLVSKINSCEYDMIAITGDMLNSYGDCDFRPFYELLDGIKNKKNMFYIGGSDLVAYDHRHTGEKTWYGKELEEKGCILLDQVHSIEKGKDKIWVSPFESISWIGHLLKEARENIQNGKYPAKLETYKLQEQYMSRLKEELEALKPSDTVIALEHYPYATDDPSHIPRSLSNYDLVIAGHYHGGQFRIPFYGALYIPDPASSRKGFFPAQEDVCGLKDWGVFQQYISKGLGASSPIPLLRFRLFNTPEINLITLVKEKQ